ncbi:class I SAM-dependent methyltransferase [Rhodococcus opacus]
MAEQGFDGLGIDLDEHMLTLARSRWPHSRFEKADAAELPLADHSVRATGRRRSFTTSPIPLRRLPRRTGCWPRAGALF